MFKLLLLAVVLGCVNQIFAGHGHGHGHGHGGYGHQLVGHHGHHGHGHGHGYGHYHHRPSWAQVQSHQNHYGYNIGLNEQGQDFWRYHHQDQQFNGHYPVKVGHYGHGHGGHGHGHGY